LLLAVAWWERPVLVSRIVISASGTTLPEGSFAVPEMLPATLAQEAEAQRTAARQRALLIKETRRPNLLNMLFLIFLTAACVSVSAGWL
jgi:hypothetical protein